MTNPDVLEFPAEPSSDLGPAVLPEFQDVAGLDELATQKESPRKSATPQPSEIAAPSEPVLSRYALAQTFVQLDRTASTLLQVTPEDEQFMAGVADGFYPIATYYTGQKPSVTTFWLIAGVTLLSYVSVKYQKVRLAQEGQGVTTNGATPE